MLSKSCHAFLSTLSLRRATYPAMTRKPHKRISIHALLAESDFFCAMRQVYSQVFLSTLSLRRATICGIQTQHLRWYFYPRSPCGERRYFYAFLTLSSKFLSTLSLRRATQTSTRGLRDKILFLSTLSLRRATQGPALHPHASPISIHALLAESDFAFIRACFNRSQFLSTLSLRRATRLGMPLGQTDLISIHALLAESDTVVDVR